MTEQTLHPSHWIPRDTNGSFKPGFEQCRECGGSGTITVLSAPEPLPDDVQEADLEAKSVECDRCSGRGAEHKNGCPRCGGEVVDHGVMPSSSHKIGCTDCGWWDLVG